MFYWVFVLHTLRVEYINKRMNLLYMGLYFVDVIQTQYRTHQNPVDSAHRITPTLIALIVLFTLLVTPSHLLGFVSLTTRRSAPSLTTYRTFETANDVTNFLLLTNFAVNFVLYLVVNADFRRVTRDLITCRQGGTCGGRQTATPSTVIPAVRYWATGGKSGVALTTDVCNLSETDAPF